jgi:transcriptional regulator with XRE-family HTH domain
MAKSIYSARQKRLGALLKTARKRARLTQADLARRLDTYSSYVSRYERGDRRLDVNEFLAVAEAIGIDAAEVLRKVRA